MPVGPKECKNTHTLGVRRLRDDGEMMEKPSLVFYEVVAQLLPLLFITLLIERAFPVQTTEGNKEDGPAVESSFQRSIDILSMWSTVLLVVTVVLGEAMTLRILFRQEATKAQQIVVIVALFFAGEASQRQFSLIS
jgi:hypothetical protein